MRNSLVLTAATLPTALGIVAALYTLAPTIAPATVPAPIVAGSASAARTSMPIVPAAVTDPRDEVFIGTGDGSGGGWGEPQVAPQVAQAQVRAAVKAAKPVKGSIAAAAVVRKPASLHATAARPRAARPGDAASSPQTYAWTDRMGSQ